MKLTMKSEYYWFIIFGVCFIAYQQVQDNIRPFYQGNNLTMIYLLGVAPNFFPGIGIPALFVALIPYVRKKDQSTPWLNHKRHITANIVSLSGLLLWEFLQMFTIKGQFDWNDVLWTCIGALIFQLIWQATPMKYKVESDTTG